MHAPNLDHLRDVAEPEIVDADLAACEEAASTVGCLASVIWGCRNPRQAHPRRP